MKRILLAALAALLIVAPAAAQDVVNPQTDQSKLVTSKGQLPGTATNDAASAGRVGEIVTASLASGSAVSLANNTAATIISISLTAGDWDVTGVCGFIPGGSTSVTEYDCGISNTNNTLDGTLGAYTAYGMAAAVPGTSVSITLPGPTVQKTLSATTTIYLIGYSLFTVATNKAYGSIRARRVR